MLGLLASAAAATAAALAVPAPAEPCQAWIAPATARVMPSARPPASAAASHTRLSATTVAQSLTLTQRVSMARDETESFQLAIVSPVDTNATVTLSGGPPGVLMHYWQVGHHWVPAIKPNPQGGPGWWPDVLLDRRTPHLSAGVAQPIWIDVTTLPSVAPGNYSSLSVAVQIGPNAVVSVRISLRVFGFTLRRPLALHNQFFLNSAKLAKVYGGGPHSPMVQKWRRELMHSFRVNPYASGSLPLLRDLPGNGSTETRVDITALRELIDGGLTSYMLPSLWLEGGAGFNQSLLAHQAATQLGPIAKQLDAAGLLHGYARWYEFDEDAQAQHAKWPVSAQQAYLAHGNLTRTFHWAKRRFPGVLTSTTQCQPATPETPRNATALPTVMDTLAIDELALHSGIYSYLYQRALVDAGKPPWLYVSWQPEPAGSNATACDYICGTNFRFANYLLDARLLAGWQTWSAEAAGFLYWGIAEWGYDRPTGCYTPPCPSPAATRAPIDADAMASSRLEQDWGLTSRQGQSDPIVGDGILAYPGVRGMLPSLRLANIRDGLEDNEYLAMLAARPGWSRQRVSDVFANNVSAAASAQPTQSIMSGPRTSSSEVVAATRLAVAEALEQSYV